MPRTSRSPKNGGFGTTMSVATSERPPGSASGTSVGCVRGRVRAFGASDSSGCSPRLTAMTASMRRRPSKASRA